MSPIAGRLARFIHLDIELDQFGTAEVIMLDPEIETRF